MGRNEHLPGKPLVYATSRNFMDYFGINSSDDLPRIKEVMAEQIIQPTLINDNDFKIPAASEESNLTLNGEGDLIAGSNEDTKAPGAGG
jgi:segregation and condensation protein B